jgi:zinc transport system substrate-binding protein
LLAVVAAALSLSACDGGPHEETDANIVTTIYPLKMIVSEITGRTESVACLLPPGASPHTFEPLAADLARIRNARLFVRVGAGLDDWAGRLLAAVERRPTTLTLMDIEGIRPIHRLAADGHAHDDGHHHSDIDPHVWLDPVRVRDHIVPALVEELVRLDPERAKDYRLSAARFRTLLSETDTKLRETLAPVRGRSFLAFHDTWRYFAERYGIEQHAAVHEFAGEEPTPREIAEIVRSLRGSETRTVIVEPQFSPRLAETVSAEIDGNIATADPMGSPDAPDRNDYDGLMRSNGESFLAALSTK